MTVCDSIRRCQALYSVSLCHRAYACRLNVREVVLLHRLRNLCCLWCWIQFDWIHRERLTACQKVPATEFERQDKMKTKHLSSRIYMDFLCQVALCLICFGFWLLTSWCYICFLGWSHWVSQTYKRQLRGHRGRIWFQCSIALPETSCSYQPISVAQARSGSVSAAAAQLQQILWHVHWTCACSVQQLLSLLASGLQRSMGSFSEWKQGLLYRGPGLMLRSCSGSGGTTHRRMSFHLVSCWPHLRLEVHFPCNWRLVALGLYICCLRYSWNLWSCGWSSFSDLSRCIARLFPSSS